MKAVMILAPQNFRDEEFFIPKRILEEAGIDVIVASKNAKTAKGMLGSIASVDIDYTEIKPNDFDAVIFVGGSGSKIYFKDEKVHEIAREFNSKGKIVAAICIAPSILANAGLLKGKKAVSFPSQKEHLIQEGALFSSNGVEQDGNIITANGPKNARKFGEMILQELEKNK